MYELLKMYRPFLNFISGIRNFKINTVYPQKREMFYGKFLNWMKEIRTIGLYDKHFNIFNYFLLKSTLKKSWHWASIAHLLIGYFSLDQLYGQSLPPLPPGLGEYLSDRVPHGVHTHLADLGADFCLRVTQGHTLSTNIRTHKLKSIKFSENHLL